MCVKSRFSVYQIYGKPTSDILAVTRVFKSSRKLMMGSEVSFLGVFDGAEFSFDGFRVRGDELERKSVSKYFGRLSSLTPQGLHYGTFGRGW